MSPDCRWTKVITCLYGHTGCLGIPKPTQRKPTTWGNICDIVVDLLSHYLDLNSLLQHYNASGNQNQSQGNWIWKLDNKRVFSVDSLRKVVDERFLPSVPLAMIWCKAVPLKSTSSFGGLDWVNCLLR